MRSWSMAGAGGPLPAAAVRRRRGRVLGSLMGLLAVVFIPRGCRAVLVSARPDREARAYTSWNRSGRRRSCRANEPGPSSETMSISCGPGLLVAGLYIVGLFLPRPRREPAPNTRDEPFR